MQPPKTEDLPAAQSANMYYITADEHGIARIVFGDSMNEGKDVAWHSPVVMSVATLASFCSLMQELLELRKSGQHGHIDRCPQPTTRHQ
jgi:hypothetical protein